MTEPGGDQDEPQTSPASPDLAELRTKPVLEWTKEDWRVWIEGPSRSRAPQIEDDPERSVAVTAPEDVPPPDTPKMPTSGVETAATPTVDPPETTTEGPASPGEDLAVAWRLLRTARTHPPRKLTPAPPEEPAGADQASDPTDDSRRRLPRLDPPSVYAGPPPELPSVPEPAATAAPKPPAELLADLAELPELPEALPQAAPEPPLELLPAPHEPESASRVDTEATLEVTIDPAPAPLLAEPAPVALPAAATTEATAPRAAHAAEPARVRSVISLMVLSVSVGAALAGLVTASLVVVLLLRSALG